MSENDERWTDEDNFVVAGEKAPPVAKPPRTVSLKEVQAPKLTVPTAPRLDPKP